MNMVAQRRQGWCWSDDWFQSCINLMLFHHLLLVHSEFPFLMGTQLHTFHGQRVVSHKFIVASSLAGGCALRKKYASDENSE